MAAKLIFLGTKGEIEESSEKHHYHSSLLITSNGSKLLIDYGMLHKYSLEELSPDAILITHAHPDHYVWLEQDIKTDIPVYLTQETLDYGAFRPANCRLITPGGKTKIGNFHCFPYRVLHSIRCPTVGFKIETNGKTLVYNPDVVDILGKEEVLNKVDYYVGDGSAIKANLVRRRGDQLFGHARITTQLNWCHKYGINNIIFTHLGKETIAAEDEFSQEHPEAVLAYDLSLIHI